MLGYVLPLLVAACGGVAPSSHPHEHHQSGMPRRFDNADAWAKLFDDPARDAWQQPERVIEALELQRGMTIADVGAGTGYFAVRLARAAPNGHVIATDIEPDMLRYLEERARREQLTNIRVAIATANDAGLAPASVDRILVVDVWHHLGDRVAYATSLATALRPGGRIAIVDFTVETTRGPPKQHRLAPSAIIDDLRAAGLLADVAATTLPDQYIIVARRPEAAP